jgi:hypothetical protein
MSPRLWMKHPGVRGATALLAVSVLVTIWTLVNALRVEAIPDVPAANVASLQGITHGQKRARTDIANVVENDLFSADRSAPDMPYRMPGDPDPNEKAVALPEKPVLLGTGTATDHHNFATVQLGGDRPTLVRVGDKIGQWVVRAIERGKITLVTATGAKVDITNPPRPGT